MILSDAEADWSPVRRAIMCYYTTSMLVWVGIRAERKQNMIHFRSVLLGIPQLRSRSGDHKVPPPLPECLLKEIKRVFVEKAVNSVVGGVRLVSFSFSPP